MGSGFSGGTFVTIESMLKMVLMRLCCSEWVGDAPDRQCSQSASEMFRFRVREISTARKTGRVPVGFHDNDVSSR